MPVLLPASVYAATYWLVYVRYLHPLFGYANFNRVERGVADSVLSLLLAIVPVLARTSRLSAASIVADLVYVGYYVPAVLTVYFSVNRDYLQVAALQLALAFGMALLFIGARFRLTPSAPPRRPARNMRAVVLVTAALIALIVVVYHEHMRFVSFADVYDLRSETKSAVTSPVIGYVVMWLSYCLLPLALTRGFFLRRSIDTLLGAAGSLAIYMSTGAKIALLLPAIVGGLWLILRTRRDFLKTTLWAVSAASLVLVFVLPDDNGVFMFTKSIVFMRTLGTTGWGVATYYEYFGDNGLTYWSHFGPINAVTGWYPYGELALGQVIGRHYTNSFEANFNAGFWASDGVAAFGTLGVVYVSFAVFAFLLVLNRLTSAYDPRFVGLWLSGFAMALLNVSFTTALVSGGAVLALAIMSIFDVMGGAARTRRVRLAPRGITELSRFGPMSP